MLPLFLLLLRIGAVSGLMCSLTGCVTRGYKLAAKDTPPPVMLNLKSSSGAAASSGGAAPAPNLEATVHTVIVYQGPGSWKREAYWDEYVVSIVNRGDRPIAVTRATLHANIGEASEPGDNPWELERIAKQWWQTNAARQTGTYLALGAGAVAGAGVAVAAGYAALLGGGGGGAAVALGAGAVIALPVIALGSVGMNLHRKHQIQDEFVRRRLVLPLHLAPGQTVQGSVFFRVTPSPRALVFRTGAENEPGEIVVSLEPLAMLHLKLPIVPTPVPRPVHPRAHP